MNIKVIILNTFLLLTAMNTNAQKIVKLWNGDSPINNGLTGDEIFNESDGLIENISSSEIHIYQADNKNNNGMAVLICPGGGYGGLALGHEGAEVAQWLNSLGITGIVLKYKMPNKHKEIPLMDAQEAIRYIRKNANELGVNANKVGIAGFSSGGHLAATASNHYTTDGVSTRPDFTILFYPVITMGSDTHEESRLNLLGSIPTSADIDRFSIEKQVGENTPPTIILLSNNDEDVSPQNSVLYYNALRENSIPVSLYIFPEGEHGWGMNKEFKYHAQMINLLEMWLHDNL